MSTPDFFRSRLDQMIDLRHPLAVLSTRLPWGSIEAAETPKLAQQAKPVKRLVGEDLAGAFEGEFGGGISPAGRPRLPVRLMVSLLYLKNSFNLSDAELVERWAENVPQRPVGADEQPAARLGAKPQAGDRRSRLPGQVQVAHRPREAPAEAAPGDRAADRPHEGRSPDGPVLAAGRDG